MKKIIPCLDMAEGNVPTLPLVFSENHRNRAMEAPLYRHFPLFMRMNYFEIYMATL